MKRRSARLLLCVTCLLLPCWTVQASEPEPTSPEPSLLKLTEEEIVSILGPEESYSVPEIATIVIELQAEARAEIKATAVEAAAAAARPMLVTIAGLEAERDSLARSRLAWALIAAALAVVAGVAIIL